MSEPLDELYLSWLYSQVGSVNRVESSLTYWSLFNQLYKKEFVWVVPNDDNRGEDGQQLRYEFLAEQEIEIEDVDPDWMNLGCSMLELLIAIAQRLSFEAEKNTRYWFWVLIKNLKLEPYNDKNRVSFDDVNVILERVIWRNYKRDGRGGLFPLKRAARDQRRVEIWYQMSEWLLEREEDE